MSGHTYREIAPGEDLGAWVERLWVFRAGTLVADARPHVIVPDGAVSVSLFAPPDGPPGIGLTGPSCRAHQAPLVPGALYGGIRLRPGTAGSLLKEDVRSFRDRIGPLAERVPALEPVQTVFKNLEKKPCADERTVEAALNEAARALAAAADPPDAPVRDLAAAIMKAGGNVRLGALMANSGPGPRQLRRRFLFQCGLSPKEFARLRRVRESCIALVRSDRMAEAALTGGFSDQAHMAREFRDVFCNSASLVRAYLQQIRHEGVTGRA